MKLSEIRKFRKKRNLLPELLVENPLLFLGLDLPFVVITAVSLKNAAALSIEMLFIHLVTMIVGWMVAHRLEVWQRVFVTATVSVGMMLLSRELAILLIPDVENSAGMYLYLMSMNGLTFFQANFLEPKSRLSNVIKTAFINILIFTGVMFGVSLLREFFGSGTLWGIPLGGIRLGGITAPFFGFILFGFLLAFTRFIRKKITGVYMLDQLRRELSDSQMQKGGKP